MNELLYQKNQAVAALNRVEGFEPLEFARTIKQEDQEDQLYLDVKYRKLWFRLANPLGRISSHIVWFNENVALAEAKIYLNYTDAPENYIANAFSMKFRSEDPKFGDKFLEMAETAAVGRALSDAGYGVQFADVGENNDPAQVDAGIPYRCSIRKLPQVHPLMEGSRFLPDSRITMARTGMPGTLPQGICRIRAGRQKPILARA